MELQSWAAKVNGACLQILNGKLYRDLGVSVTPFACQLVRGNVEEGVKQSYHGCALPIESSPVSALRECPSIREEESTAFHGFRFITVPLLEWELARAS